MVILSMRENSILAGGKRGYTDTNIKQPANNMNKLSTRLIMDSLSNLFRMSSNSDMIFLHKKGEVC